MQCNVKVRVYIYIYIYIYFPPSLALKWSTVDFSVGVAWRGGGGGNYIFVEMSYLLKRDFNILSR